MQDPQYHLSAAIRNEEFATTISALPARYTEWEVTGLFYSALHYVDAYLATQGYSPGSHSRRNKLVYDLTSVGDDYRDMFDLSMEARYELARFTPQQVDQIRTGLFRRVKEEILSLL